MDSKEIISKLPYSKPFLFVDEIEQIDENGITGSFTYSPSLDFYSGHFKDFPVTPGVILTETMAQIGLVCLGIFLVRDQVNEVPKHIMLTSTAIDFLKPVFPGEKVTVVSVKNYFRFKKLSCQVVMRNASGEDVCRGALAGMVTNRMHG